MATDGVKIVDGDDAHDLYWGIMDLYDQGADLDTIREKYPIADNDDDFEYEIFITVYALAFWEMGALTDELLHEVRTTIDKGAGVRDWTEECGATEGKARQKELNKLWRKISKPNLKVRPRKKYRKVVHFYFQPNDLLVFQVSDKSYRAVICVLIKQYRGNCEYLFVPTTFQSTQKPTLETVLEKEVLGRHISTSYDRQATKLLQPGIERIWALYPAIGYPFLFGLVQFGVNHTKLLRFKNRFEKVGSLAIQESLKWTGSIRYEENFDRIEEMCTDLTRHQRVPIRTLCNP